MKKVFALLVGLLMITGVSIAGDRPSGEVFEPPEHDKGYIGYSTKMWGYGYFNNAVIDTATITSLTATIEREKELPIGAFLHEEGTELTSSTIPNFAVEDGILGLTWDDAQTTQIQITFRVPADYSSGGAFRVMTKASNTTTQNYIGYDVFVNRTGLIVDSSGTTQTTVVCTDDASSPGQAVLPVATDFASLAAGDWITFSIWRDDNALAGTAAMELFGATFYYTATQ